MSNLRAIGAPAVLALALGFAGPAAAADVTVAVTAIVEHPALDAARQGIQDELAAEGYVAGKNLDFRFESAQGNPAIAAQIAQKFVGDAPDVIVPISTPSAQAVAAATKTIPIVFTAVTDPVGAKLVASLEHPGGNITGMTDLSPIGAHLDLIKEITPDVASLGVIYNPGEANSVTLLDLLRQEAPARGIEIEEAAAPRSSDVLAAAQSLVGKVDAIYVPTDNTVVTALEAVIGVGIENELPVYAGDTELGAARRHSGARFQLPRRRYPDRQDRRPRAARRGASRYSGATGRDHRAVRQSRSCRTHGRDHPGRRHRPRQDRGRVGPPSRP